MSIHDCLIRMTAAYRCQVSGAELLEWEDALSGATDDELNLATSQLIKSSKYMPRPADVWTVIDRVRVERAPAPEPVEEHWHRRTYTCPACQDTGLRTVWHPQTMAASVKFVRGQMTEEAWRCKVSTCCVKCICGMGKAKRLHKDRRFEPARYNGDDYEPGELTYRSEIMVEVDRSLSLTDRVEALQDWARSYEDRRPANYVEAFDDWN